MTIRRSALVVAVLVLAACGTETTTAPPTETTTLDSTTSEPTIASTSPTEDAASAASLAAGPCAAADIALSTALKVGLAGPFADLGLEPPDLENLANADAPDEIAADLDTIADAYITYTQAFADVGFDISDPTSLTPEEIAALDAAAAATVESPEFEAALERMTAWFEENCPAS